MKLLALLFLLFTQQAAFGQAYTSIDLTGNPKAKGLSIAVKYPQGWDVRDGNRPNIVKKFVYAHSDYVASLMVQVKNIPNDELKEAKNLTSKDWQEIWSAQGEVSNSKTLTIEGQKVYVSDVIMKADRMDASMIQKQRVATIFYKDKWIFLWCGVGAYASMPMAQVESKFQATAPICYQFFNSLVLLDRY